MGLRAQTPRRQRLYVAGAVIGVIAIVEIGLDAGVRFVHDHPATRRGSSQHRVVPTWPPLPKPVTKPTNVNGDRFVPHPAASSTARISARAAYTDYSNGDQLPSNVTVTFGTVSTGDTGRAGGPVRDVPVWAYVVNRRCGAGGGGVPIPESASAYCTTWTFLDAATGAEIDSTQRKPSGGLGSLP